MNTEMTTQMPTDEELAILIRIAAREQRHAVLEAFNARCCHGTQFGSGFTNAIQNTPCPDAPAVIAQWREIVAKTREDDAIRTDGTTRNHVTRENGEVTSSLDP